MLTGLVYGLMALGLSVIFGVVRVVNFAHGEMMTVAMYLAVVLFAALGLDPLLMMVPIAAVLFAFGYVHAAGLINPFISRPEHSQFMLLVAIAIIIVNGLLIVFGPGRPSVQTSYAFDSFQIGPLIVDATKALCRRSRRSLVAAALFAFFRFTPTRHGDPRLRRQLHRRAGRRPQRQAALCADLRYRRGLRGCRRRDAGADHRCTPSLGPAYTLLAFIIVITGGLGSMPGAMLGGILIGVTEALAGLLFTPSAKSMFVFAILVLVLLFRPQGILGRARMIARLAEGVRAARCMLLAAVAGCAHRRAACSPATTCSRS